MVENESQKSKWQSLFFVFDSHICLLDRLIAQKNARIGFQNFVVTSFKVVFYVLILFTILLTTLIGTTADETLVPTTEGSEVAAATAADGDEDIVDGGEIATDDHSVCRTSQRYDADSDEDQMLQPHPQFWLFLHITDELVNVFFHHRYPFTKRLLFLLLYVNAMFLHDILSELFWWNVFNLLMLGCSLVHWSQSY